MTDVLIDRELLELSLNSDEQQQAKARNKLREQLAAPRQPEGDGLWVVGLIGEDGLLLDLHGRVVDPEKYRYQSLCLLTDHQRAIAELREECERLRVKLMTIASAEPGRHNIEWAKAMAATGNNEAYAKWREAFDQRDKLAGLLREVRVIVAWEVERWTRSAAILPVNANVESGLLTRIDAALDEVKLCQESPLPAAM